MTVSIRSHHLLCMLTYLGKGYTPDFVANYSAVIARINAGEDILLVTGPDDICQPMLKEAECHCHNDSVQARDAKATAELGRLLGRSLTPDCRLVLDAEATRQLRNAFAASRIRAACDACEWQELCTRIAGNEFRGCHLAPPS